MLVQGIVSHSLEARKLRLRVIIELINYLVLFFASRDSAKVEREAYAYSTKTIK